MYTPNYKNLENAARNLPTDRIPLYEHIIGADFIEKATGERFAYLFGGDYDSKRKFFTIFNNFQREMGYDAVPYEGCVSSILPGGGALGGHKKGVIGCREDFEKYPWDTLADRYFSVHDEYFRALRDTLPDGMKAVGGVGNGVFECVQDLVGYMDLCYIKADDPELYRDLFNKVGEIISSIWKIFLEEYGDIYCVCRFGDDLGFRTSTLISADDIKELVIPQYKKVVDMVHKAGKPFLLHSCGCIFSVMDDMIDVAGIDAKHSNEDAISPYSRWIDEYGDRIGNFGGLDTDALCDVNNCDIEKYTGDVFEVCAKKGHGIAIGSGNSIPYYVSVERYMKSNKILRNLRGEIL
ncbi:MAG: uroporphyrinogen decarboxylase family protein [Eubacteriales bacterium]